MAAERYSVAGGDQPVEALVDFFLDDNRRLHGGRIAGVLYLLPLIPGFVSGPIEWMKLARLTFTAGWWLAFCDQKAGGIFPIFSMRGTLWLWSP
jgi:hypothetical protein